MKSWGVVAAMVFAGVPCWGCGSDSREATVSGDAGDAGDAGDPAAPVEPIAREEIAQRYAAAYCEFALECCGADPETPAAATCESRLALLVVSDTDLPGVAYDPELGGACVQALASAGCDLTDESSQALLIPCSTMFYPTRADGEPCTRYEECIDPENGHVMCDFAQGDLNAGVCSTTIYQSAGATCGVGGLVCDLSALFCSAAGICEPRYASGPCSDGTSSCSLGSYCADGDCAPLPVEGETCDHTDLCAGYATCDEDPTTGELRCFALRGGGELCDEIADCRSYVCLDGRCATPAEMLCRNAPYVSG